MSHASVRHDVGDDGWVHRVALQMSNLRVGARFSSSMSHVMRPTSRVGEKSYAGLVSPRKEKVEKSDRTGSRKRAEPELAISVFVHRC
jgi:hypothetical protein